MQQSKPVTTMESQQHTGTEKNKIIAQMSNIFLKQIPETCTVSFRLS
jgi:hypothetical protein